MVCLLLALAAPSAAAQVPGAPLSPAPGAVGKPAGTATPSGTEENVGSRRGPALEPQQPFRPNVLLVVADDMGTDVVGAYAEGGDLPATPRMDALADEGVLFRNAWAAPNCSPSRAMLLTGRHGFRTGIGTVVDQKLQLGQTLSGLPLAEITLPEMLSAGTRGAYRSGLIGKWHLGADALLGGMLAPNLAGFDHFAGGLTNFETPETYFGWTRIVNGEEGPSHQYATSAAVNDALEFIDTSAEPWFCQVSFHAPHFPFHDPPAALHNQDLSTPSAVRQYRAMIEALDTELGRLLDALPEPVRARTTVLVIGDNGTPGNVIVAPQDPAKGKGTLFEGGVRVPLIASGWGVSSPGRESNELVSAVDLFPTIAGLAGVDLGDVMGTTTLDGVDLGPVLADPVAAGDRSHLFAEIFNPTGVPASPFPSICQSLGPVCQTDIGFAGPGSATLTICGDELWGGHTAELVVTNGVPNAAAFIFLAFDSVPTPFMGGTLAASPSIDIVPVTLDPGGGLTTSIIGGVGLGTMTFQVAITDAGQPQGFALTNAVEAEQHPADLKAIGDGRWKLALNVYTCEARFHDLSTDPSESIDLLLSPLNSEQQTAYDELTGAMDALVNSP